MTKEIILSRGKVALVDEQDYELLSMFKWSTMGSGKKFYAYRWTSAKAGPKKCILMHRFLMGAIGKTQVDHRDNDGLNNTRSNIRLCTAGQNKYNIGVKRNNTSGVKGVTWDKARKKWLAQMQVGGKHKYLGRFAKIEEARAAYAKAAAEVQGEFMRLE